MASSGGVVGFTHGGVMNVEAGLTREIGPELITTERLD